VTERDPAGRWSTAWWQALPLRCLWELARRLPLPLASRLGGSLLALLGPLSRKQRHVRRNLSFVKPAANDAELARLARGMWRNFGSVLFEMPHLAALRDRMTIEQHPETRALLERGEPVMFMTAHVGNWELLTGVVASLGQPFVVVYTADDNPWLEHSIQRMRDTTLAHFVDKGDALKAMLAAGEEGRCIGLLQDVRVDSGVPLPLFGVETLCTVSPARIALRLNYPIVPLQVTRRPGVRFDVRFHAPLPAPGTSGKAAALALTASFNRLLEEWVAAHPEQWLCTKRRWPKSSAPVRPC